MAYFQLFIHAPALGEAGQGWRADFGAHHRKTVEEKRDSHRLRGVAAYHLKVVRFAGRPTAQQVENMINELNEAAK